VQRGANPQPLVFLSHSSCDAERARELAGRLESTGRCTTWIDTESIQLGENYANAVHHAILHSDAFVVLLSREAVESQHVRREMGIAVSASRRILPVAPSNCLRHCSLPLDWRYWLETVQILYEDNMRTAAHAIINVIHEPPPPAHPTGVGAARQPQDSSEIPAELKRSIIQATRGTAPFTQILHRCRRLGFTREEVTHAVTHLTSSGLIEVDVPLVDDSVIRLRM